MKGRLLDVPHIRQRMNYCGPATLTSVLNYYGIDITQDEIGARTGAEYFGVSIGELQRVSQEEGIPSSIGQLSLDEMICSIDLGNPMIVAQRKDIVDDQAHFRVVVGYGHNPEKLFIIDPDLSYGVLEVPFTIFQVLWDTQGYRNVGLRFTP